MTQKQIETALQLVRDCQRLVTGNRKAYNKLLKLGSILVREQRRNGKI